MVYSFYHILWFFVLYACIGWCVEVAYATVETGKFVNRGFLSGPVCPIYGFGVVGVILCLTPFQDNILVLFIGSVILTSFLEFMTGFVLEKVFHSKWWDYSEVPFNLCGYICLKFSLLWGAACVFVLNVIHPLLFKLVLITPYPLGVTLLCLCLAAFAVDGSVTIATMLKFRRRIRLLDELSGKLRELSDNMGEAISDNMTDILEYGDDMKELVQKYKALLENKQFGHGRLLRAFPQLQLIRHNEVLEKLKNYHLSNKSSEQ